MSSIVVCPEGYYGDHCMTPCECKNDNFICHPVDGCICKHGFTGEFCEESNILQRKAVERQEASYGVIAAVVMVSIIFVAIVVLLIVYYRRRVSNLKTEIAHVQYIADPSAFPPGKLQHCFICNEFVMFVFLDHVDNPVYLYQNGGKRDNEQLLNNATKIVNNLHKPTNANLDRARLGMACCSTDDEDFSKGKHI